MDISELKNAEDKLRESQYLIQQITDATPNILYVFNIRKNKTVYINKEITDVLGYTPEEIKLLGGDALTILFHPEDVSKIKENISKMKNIKGNEVLEFEYRLKHKKGDWRWISTRETVFRKKENGDA